MTNSNACAFPADYNTHGEGGLTKREYFAAMAMQGLLASSNFLSDHHETYDRRLRRITRHSISLADNLIEELNVNIDELMKYYELLDKEKYDSDKS